MFLLQVIFRFFPLNFAFLRLTDHGYRSLQETSAPRYSEMKCKRDYCKVEAFKSSTQQLSHDDVKLQSSVTKC